ncbi:MAG: hypothetical protein AB1609_02495 [Bacillota bacterium]
MEQVSHLNGPLLHLALFPAARVEGTVAEADHEVLQAGEPGKWVDELKRTDHPEPGDIMGRGVGDVAAPEGNAPLGGPDEPVSMLNRVVLPAPIGSDFAT